jgi:hypothetical protein
LEEFEESAPALLPRLGAESWALSALLGSDIEQDIERIEVFNERHRDARSAFPSGAQVARFLSRCIARNVAFKATAGLHHPLRAEYRLTYAPDAPTGTMFGFLNVLLAVAALRAGERLAGTEPVAILDERDSRAFEFDDRGVRWRGHAFPLDLLTEARDSMVTFGSCSFREPMDALRAMSLL